MLNGRKLAEDAPAFALRNRIVMFRSYGLPAGMPPPEFAATRKDSLVAEAKAPGVQTREEVAKADGINHRTWRSTADFAAECRSEWERRHRTRGAGCSRGQKRGLLRGLFVVRASLQHRQAGSFFTGIERQ